MPGALGQIRKSAFPEEVIAALGVQLQFAFEDVEKALRGRGPERPSSCELGGHLREARSHSGRGVDDEIHAIRTGQGRANKCIRRLQQVVGFQAAPGRSEMMHADLVQGNGCGAWVDCSEFAGSILADILSAKVGHPATWSSGTRFGGKACEEYAPDL